MSGGTLMVWLRVCSASIGVPAAIRPITGTATGRLPSSSEAGALTERLPSVPSMTLGVKPRRPLAADEAALLQRRNEAVDSRFRTQIERVLHLVERGRHAGLFQPFIDETQKFILFARKHREQSPGWHSLRSRNVRVHRRSPKLPTIDTSSRNKS